MTLCRLSMPMLASTCSKPASRAFCLRRLGSWFGLFSCFLLTRCVRSRINCTSCHDRIMSMSFLTVHEFRCNQKSHSCLRSICEEGAYDTLVQNGKANTLFTDITLGSLEFVSQCS